MDSPVRNGEISANSGNSLRTLINTQRTLVEEERQITKMLEDIRKIKNKLLLEQMELECLTMSNDTNLSYSPSKIDDMNETETIEDQDSNGNDTLMKAKLDLSMSDILTAMTEGNFYVEESESEHDSDDD